MAWMRVPAFYALLITLGGLTACSSVPHPAEPIAATPGADQVPVAKDDPAKFKSDIIAPDWMQRLRTSTNRNAAGEPDFSVKGVQPLLQTVDKSDTLFTDVRMDGGENAGNINARSNIGLGYRRMVSNDLIAGVGEFYDRDWTDTSKRAATEAQIKWKTVDLNAGYYVGLDSAAEPQETTPRAMDGYQLALAAPLPYLPWARASVADSSFFGKDDRESRSAAMQIGLMQHVQLDAGMHDDGLNLESGYVRLGLIFDGNGDGGLKRYLFSRDPVAAVPFESRDLSGSTLDAIPHPDVIERDD